MRSSAFKISSFCVVVSSVAAEGSGESPSRGSRAKKVRQPAKLIQLTAALKEQFQRHCFIKIHDQKTQLMRVPFVKPYTPRPESTAWYVNEVLKKSGARTAGTINVEIEHQKRTLEKA